MEDLRHIQGGGVSYVVRARLESGAEHARGDVREIPADQLAGEISRPGPPP
jgi:hypothetical protein